MITEKFGDFIGHKIAQHTTKSTGDDTHQDRDQGRLTNRGRKMGACGAKQAEADGIRYLQKSLAAFQMSAAYEGGAGDADGKHSEQQRLVLDPKEGASIEQDIAQGATAKGRQKGADADADDVHAFTQGANDPGNRKSGNRQRFKNEDRFGANHIGHEVR